jgi:hypothetical protein
MTPDAPYQRTLLDDLDERQNDVLAQLDELNTRIERVLKEHAPASHEAAGGEPA